MPKFREVYIEKEKSLDDSGTLPVEVAVVDPISELHIIMSAKNGGQTSSPITGSNEDSPLARCVSKIELVDGSNVIYSLNEFMAQAMSYYQRRKMPSMQRQ